MKRSGRQHGAIPSYPVRPIPLSDQRRHAKTVDSASLSGLFTKVSKKPTNQPKYTGLGSSIRSVYKSKDKAKGTVKLRSVGSHDRQLTIGCPTGTSAIDALAYLARDEGCEDEDVSYYCVGEGYENDGWY